MDNTTSWYRPSLFSVKPTPEWCRLWGVGAPLENASDCKEMAAPLANFPNIRRIRTYPTLDQSWQSLQAWTGCGRSAIAEQQSQTPISPEASQITTTTTTLRN